MEESSFETALGRIDAAAARIKKAAENLPGEDTGLRDRHSQLKASVSKTLEQLDILIAEQAE